MQRSHILMSLFCFLSLKKIATFQCLGAGDAACETKTGQSVSDLSDVKVFSLQGHECRANTSLPLSQGEQQISHTNETLPSPGNWESPEH